MLATKYGPDYAERRNTAFHEAGHAVASYRLPHADKVTQVTVVETDDEAGHSSIRRLGIQTLNTWRDNICALLAGGASAQLFTGSKPGCEDDVLQARGEAKKVAQYGRGELSVADLKRRIERVMAQEEKRAVALMRLYAPVVKLVAAVLQHQDVLTHEQIVQMIGPIPEKPSMWTRMKELLGCCRRPNPP
uniref:Peptidase_M41 domain-containing protein n=1 Tax=Globodera pallida TaxID=36090 RepID=A0A183CFZ1_GLOPA